LASAEVDTEVGNTKKPAAMRAYSLQHRELLLL
jgi:hypothetical protein